MTKKPSMRIPPVLGIIPDGNRRWAKSHGKPTDIGYQVGMVKAVEIMEACHELGVNHIVVYGYSMENAKRSPEQVRGIINALVAGVEIITQDEEVSVIACGHRRGKGFPKELRKYAEHIEGLRKRVSILANYNFAWDIRGLRTPPHFDLRSAGVPDINLIVRWGGMRRLSGFMPSQSAYSDLYFVDPLWPDAEVRHLEEAFEWYKNQDVTKGG